ncbi:type II toxin-antitoxin system RelE/ParE family toxin [Geofilum rhodophaeum]|uniref:type II toxin-antitoxin system RelE/ParE family toxin n=1 Tax=Geofilum rhodophaeum TaxID=1965019 RepID=UPI000B5221BE|nr:type II toxin-antitoxin system RelE/ParE family toxin [Geofilum rhodophaeum]
MTERFKVELLDEALEFVESLDEKTREKVIAFWDKSDKPDTVVISTHGIIKKTAKVPKSEIERAERIRKEYFERKSI